MSIYYISEASGVNRGEEKGPYDNANGLGEDVGKTWLVISSLGPVEESIRALVQDHQREVVRGPKLISRHSFKP